MVSPLLPSELRYLLLPAVFYAGRRLGKSAGAFVDFANNDVVVTADEKEVMRITPEQQESGAYKATFSDDLRRSFGGKS